MPTIERPHPDIELGVAREPFAYAIQRPTRGASSETGVIFYIPGFGFRFDDAYAVKLLPYLADTYDCLAVSVDYHGARLFAGQAARRPAPDFFANLKARYGISVSAPAGTDINRIMDALCNELAARGIKELPPECHTVSGLDGYANFGILPALDHLQVLGTVLAAHRVNRKRIFVLGTSYGGYLALLLAKLAPATFRLVVDNSGFSGPDDTPESVFGITASAAGVRIVNRSLVAFSPNPQSPFFLSPPRKTIRDLAVADHYTCPSHTVLHSYHSAIDTVAPTAAKQHLAEVLRPFRNYDLRLISRDDIDGRLFKTATHGMNASLRGLFDLSYRRWNSESTDAADHTDFDLRTTARFPCGEEDYLLTFGNDGVTLAIEPA